MERLIDHLCDQFESAWQQGQRQTIEAIMAQASIADRGDLLYRLVRLEAGLRQAAGDSPTLDEYLKRFPRESSIVDAAFEDSSAETRAAKKNAEFLSVTKDYAGDTPASRAGVARTLPSADSPGEMIGRYRIKRLLGEGAFGSVWLAIDEELQRRVAIKVPKPERFRGPQDAEAYLAEARTVASLDHSHIVPVYDVGRTAEGSIYVVSKYIEGHTLADRMGRGRLPLNEITKLLTTSAQALHHAHGLRLIHRDIKPANILYEARTGTHYVADFGLAILEEDHLRDGRIAGTPAYMSPEQARGEGHRLDGRSDVFALGVMMYELLTGKRPFRGSTPNEIYHNIITFEPPPPRSIESDIPDELQRICLKALAKRAADRYATAAEMAEDLTQWQQGPASSPQEQMIVPKGLRSFDADDADFFLDLLPGPRDRSGLPASLRFWKTRIEARDPEQTFNVGLIYGPSGCGKSSLVKAGLVPRLSKQVLPLYLEATPDETETRILRALQKHIAALPANATLAETFAWLRRQKGPKIVIIVDQFEQWLHAHRGETDAELVTAFRQCDGTQLQTIVMVRDDFAMAAARFMNLLEVPILEGKNFATVDRFDIDHAKSVLIKFGRAFGKLPAAPTPLADHEHSFVSAVVGGLAEDGHVVSVRLSLFAEMVKSKPWTMQTLSDVGGTDGIGVNFLEETFSSRNANPTHRLHEDAARDVLRSLLPHVTTDIKGHMRSHADLLQVSGYESRPADFNALLRILDGELRLISPTDPEGDSLDGSSRISSLATRYYQLTHDYMVPALREWLTRKQQETRAGRAELKLAERTNLWTARPENRYLPSLFEWLSIRTLTNHKQWTTPQQSLMKRASQVHSSRVALGLAASVLLLLGGFWTKARVDEEQARTRVAALLSAETRDVPKLVSELTPYRKWADRELQAALESTDSKNTLHARIALLPVDASQVEPLRNALLDTTPENVLVLREVLQASGDHVAESYWSILQSPDASNQERLAAGAALAKFAPNDERWIQVAGSLSNLLVNENPLRLASWIDAFHPVRKPLIPKLGDIFRDQSDAVTPTQRELATNLLETYAADDIDELAALILDAQPTQFAALFDEFAAFEAVAKNKMIEAIDRKPIRPARWDSHGMPSLNEHPTRNADRALIQSADGMLTDEFALVQALPLDQFKALSESLGRAGYRPVRLRPYNSSFVQPNPDNVSQVSKPLAAAIWHRDGRPWKLATNLTADEIYKEQESRRTEGFAAVDVAGYLELRDGQPTELFTALWVKQTEAAEDSRIYLAAVDAEHSSKYSELTSAGYVVQSCLQVFRGVDGQPRFSGVKTKQSGIWNAVWARTPGDYAQVKHYDKLPCDINLSPAPAFSSITERYTREHADSTESLTADPGNINARYARALAFFHLKHVADALSDLDIVLEAAQGFADGYMYRAFCHAALGNEYSANADIQQYAALGASGQNVACAKAIVSAHVGDFETAIDTLDSESSVATSTADALYAMASAYATLLNILTTTDKNPDRASALRDKALTTLSLAIERGYTRYDYIQQNPDWEIVQHSSEFKQIINRGGLDRHYAATWNSMVDVEARELHDMSRAEHLQSMQVLESEGFLPMAITALVTGGDGETHAASIWHRKVTSHEPIDRLERQKANAVTALARLNDSEKLFAGLRIADNPEALTQFVHRCRESGITSRELLALLNVADQKRQTLSGEPRKIEDRVLFGLLLALGEFPLSGVPEPQRAVVLDKIEKWFANDPSSAIHGAAGWLLRQWGQSDVVQRIERTPLAYDPNREWFTLAIDAGEQQIYQTYVVISPGEYEVGTPTNEPGRYSHETKHRVRLSRPVAILDREVTNGEFEASKIHTATREISPSDDHPFTAVGWYESVKYCRWLTEQAGFTEADQSYADPSVLDEAAYPRDGDTGFPKNWPVDIAKPGFRLPTESEWEIAARAGMNSMYSFGSDERLLDRYARYQDNSLRETHPAKTLRPNFRGLFDIHGNVFEWCHDWYTDYPTKTTLVDPKGGETGAGRTFRGGSWDSAASECRAAHRSAGTPSYRFMYLGFRLALTPSVRTSAEPSRATPSGP